MHVNTSLNSSLHPSSARTRRGRGNLNDQNKNWAPIRIIQDTREQRPFDFSLYHALVGRDTLTAGDYTMGAHDMPGDDHSVMIERKQDAQELLTDLGAEWDRFVRNKLIPLRAYRHKAIVVCSNSDIEMLVNTHRTRLNLPFIYKQIATCHAQYGVPIMFFPSSKAAAAFVFRFFKEIYDISAKEDDLTNGGI